MEAPLRAQMDTMQHRVERLQEGSIEHQVVREDLRDEQNGRQIGQQNLSQSISQLSERLAREVGIMRAADADLHSTNTLTQQELVATRTAQQKGFIHVL